MTTHSTPGHYHHSHHSTEAALATMLDLEGKLLQAHWREILQWSATHAAAPSTIVDLGAGTGTGTLELAHTFPEAHVVAVDQSALMLQHVSEVAAKQQLTQRVTRVQIDLDDAWPHLPDTDLVWAASSLHHLQDPQQTLHQIADSLAPRGALIVVEMDTLPRYLPDDIGVGRPRLEHRLHAAAAQAGANAHPDWALSIQEAGMELREQRTFSYHLTHDTELIAQHAHTFFLRLSEGLAHSLADEDLTTLEKILDPHHPLSLTNRTDLSLRGSRTVWAAHLPDTATEHLFKE